MSDIFTMAGGNDASAPSARSLLTEGMQTQAAQRALAPGQLELTKTYAPQYADLAWELYNKALPAYLKTLSTNQPTIDKIQAGSRSFQRGADIADVARYGAAATDAARAADPNRARLIDSLTASAQAGLDAGTRLTPNQAREFAQATRTAQAARGMGYGPADLYAEAATQGQAGVALQQQRQAAARDAVSLAEQAYGNPWQTVTRSQGTADAGAAVGQANQTAGAGASAAAAQFDPYNSYANSVYGQNYSGQLQSNLNNSQIQAGAASNFDKNVTGLTKSAMETGNMTDHL